MDEIILLAGGFLAGIVGGLLGVGGGILLMPLLRFFFGMAAPLAVGTCILGVFFTTLGGSYRHYRLGHVQVRSLIPVAIAGGVATLVASLLFPSLAASEQWLDFGIGLVFLLVAGRMIFEGLGGALERRSPGPVAGRLGQKLAIGGLAGALPGLFGIGTGVILVPAFHYLLGMTLKVAMGASLTCFCVNAGISSAIKLGQGYVDLAVAAPICIGTVCGANVGAILNRNSRTRTVRLICGLFFLFVAGRFVWAAMGERI